MASLEVSGVYRAVDETKITTSGNILPSGI
jgi:hypothetical protein